MSALLGASLLDPGHLLATLGLAGLLGVVFAECGLLVGFFLPGDSLLFTAGLLVANGSSFLPKSIELVCLLVSVAAVAGNLTGYWIGYRAGPALFRKQDAKVFKPEYVVRTQEFFERFGPVSLVLARFVPIVRTFITAMAGAGRMSFVRFALWSVVGGVLWATSVTLLGYWLGRVTFVKNHIDLILVGVVALSVLPIVVELLRRRRRARRSGRPEPAAEPSETA
jgi:membrane-associated protein